MLFDVRIISFDPHGSVDPVDALVRLFKVEVSFAREVVHRLPRVVKRGVELEMAQRLGLMLEKIGARVEILVADRVASTSQADRQTQGDRAPAQEHVDQLGRGGRQNGASAARGLPPVSARGPEGALRPSRASLPQQPANSNGGGSVAARGSVPERGTRFGESGAYSPREPAATGTGVPRKRVDISSVPTQERDDTQRMTQHERAQVQRAQAAPAGRRSRPDDNGSLPDPSFQTDVSATWQAAAQHARSAQNQPEPTARASLPRAQEPSRLSDTHAGNLRAVARASSVEEAMAARVSLPMGSWSEAQGEESRVTRSEGRASLPGAPVSMPSDAQAEPPRPSVGLPPPKQSVKEILARRSLAGQALDGHERGVRPGSATRAAPEPLSLPTFPARGGSLADELDELPGTPELRSRLSIVTAVLLFVCALATAGLLPLALLMRRLGAARRRRHQLRLLQASSLLVGQAQLPELYTCIKHLAIRLDISPSPRLYVAERLPSKVQSFLFQGGLMIFLDAGLVATCAWRDAGTVLQFALAHEMAAYALGQHGRWRSFLARSWLELRKRDLFGADALAAKLLPDCKEAARALASLLCGPELVHLLDLSELERQATNQELELPSSAARDPSLLLPRILQLRRAGSA